MRRIRRRRGYRKWPFMVGALLILSAAALFAYNRIEDARAGRQADAALRELHEQAALQEAFFSIEDAVVSERGIYLPSGIDLRKMEMPALRVNGDLYVGSLYFPDLKLELPVMKTWSYPNLETAPCMYSGSIYGGGAVIAAHNYMSHFGRLTELDLGDRVLFTDIDGNVFSYEVAVREIIGPTEIDEMISSGFDLSLFTCTLGGASRFTVRCKQILTV